MRNTRLVKAFALLAAAVLLVVSFSACGGTEVPKGSVTVSFMYGGDYSVVKLYGRLIEEFNKTVGDQLILNSISRFLLRRSHHETFS